MDRPVLVVAVAVLAALAGPAGGAVLGASPTDADGNATSGETLAGALAAHESDLQGELDRRELAVTVERADGDAATAAVLAERRLTVERQAAAIADRRDRLRAARETGESPATGYRVWMTRLAARAAALRTVLSDLENRSAALSSDLRSAYGLDAAALNRSRLRVAAADPRDPLGPGGVEESRRTRVGAALARNGTERALADVERRQAELEAAIEALADDDADATAIECSRSRLSDSRAATDRAREALADDAAVEAEGSLVDGTAALQRAIGCLRDLPAFESVSDSYEFRLADREYDGVDYDGERNRPESPDGEYDDRWTTTPTPSADRDWSWEGSTPTPGGTPTPGKDSSFDHATPTPSEDS
jgi:hypothetical protein